MSQREIAALRIQAQEIRTEIKILEAAKEANLSPEQMELLMKDAQQRVAMVLDAVLEAVANRGV
ncbi:MAG TPA: hypothetical protein PK765_06720 [bacterium]|nr:hypothetical protein [bacterium]